MPLVHVVGLSAWTQHVLFLISVNSLVGVSVDVSRIVGRLVEGGQDDLDQSADSMTASARGGCHVNPC